jgi:hypothetical protein
MVNSIPETSPDERGEDGRWIALAEVGSILRAVLLAAVALAIGWAASTWVEGAGFRAPVTTAVMAQ